MSETDQLVLIRRNFSVVPKKEWPLIWCTFNAKEFPDIYPFSIIKPDNWSKYSQEDKKEYIFLAMKFIQDEIDLKILLFFWNEVYNDYTQRKIKILEQLLTSSTPQP